MTDKVKIVCVGPPQSGKTHLCSYLFSAPKEEKQVPYTPTIGTRILEFEHGAVDIELWDCSGDKKFENCWPAIAAGANGVILMADASQRNLDRDLKPFYNFFIKAAGVPEKNCLGVFYLSSKETRRPTVSLGSVRFSTFLPSEFDKFRRDFADLVETLIRK